MHGIVCDVRMQDAYETWGLWRVLASTGRVPNRVPEVGVCRGFRLLTGFNGDKAKTGLTIARSYSYSDSDVILGLSSCS